MNHIRPGLFTAALNWADRPHACRGELRAAAYGAALKFLSDTGETYVSARDIMTALAQAAGDPCAEHCDEEPICPMHEMAVEP